MRAGKDRVTGTVVQVSVSQGGIPKLARPSAEVTEMGIAGDAWRYPFHGGRQQAILLITIEAIDELLSQGLPLFPGALGENLTTRGIGRFAIGFASSERASDVIVSLAVYARGVNLYFIYGVALADPHHLLLGSGNQGRFVRLESAATLDRPEIDALLPAAIEEGDPPLPRSGRGRIVIKSVSPKQRVRRPSSGSGSVRRT